MNIGEKIKNLRAVTGLSQEQFAKELKIVRSILACYETNRNQIPYDLLVAIAKYFEVTTDYLLGLED